MSIMKLNPNLEFHRHAAALLPAYIPGFVASAVVGDLSIRWLIGYLTRRPLYVFAAY